MKQEDPQPSGRGKRRNRWAYMAAPGYNPPNNNCPECTEPSVTYHIGDKTVDGVPQQRWKCQHGHQWIIRLSPG